MGMAADILLIFHFLYFLFCVGGEGAILVGFFLERIGPAARLGFGWIRKPLLRRIHLAAVGIVGIEGILGVLCPLTVWEYALRRAAGQSVESEIPLVSRIVRVVLFYDFPFWVFTLLYVGFTALVVATYFLVPPKKKSQSGS